MRRKIGFFLIIMHENGEKDEEIMKTDKRWKFYSVSNLRNIEKGSDLLFPNPPREVAFLKALLLLPHEWFAAYNYLSFFTFLTTERVKREEEGEKICESHENMLWSIIHIHFMNFNSKKTLSLFLSYFAPLFCQIF